MPASVISEAPPQAPPAEQLLRDAEAWAAECGLTRPFTLTGPEKVEYPRAGFGYTVLVNEQEAPGRRRATRMGTAKFDAQGRRAMWTIDGMVVL